MKTTYPVIKQVLDGTDIPANLDSLLEHMDFEAASAQVRASVSKVVISYMKEEYLIPDQRKINKWVNLWLEEHNNVT